MTTILFDFLGTLIDSYTLVDNITANAKELGQAPKGYQSLPEMLAASGNNSKAGALKQIKQLFKDRPLGFQLFAPLMENVQILKHAGFHFGVVAPKCGLEATKICEANHADLFDFIDAESTLFGGAPALAKILKKHALTPENVFYVSGNAKHILLAKQQGLKCIAVRWGLDSLAALHEAGPNFYISQPGELITIITEQLQ